MTTYNIIHDEDSSRFTVDGRIATDQELTEYKNLVSRGMDPFDAVYVAANLGTELERNLKMVKLHLTNRPSFKDADGDDVYVKTEDDEPKLSKPQMLKKAKELNSKKEYYENWLMVMRMQEVAINAFNTVTNHRIDNYGELSEELDEYLDYLDEAKELYKLGEELNR